MKLELRKLLQMLGVLQPDPVFYIGGSDVLPQPLPRRRSRRCCGSLLQEARAPSRRSSSAICVWWSIWRGALKTPASVWRT